jgi:hypothetical protein
MKKLEYVKLLKRLIKKYHPDVCRDEHLEALYTETTKKLIARLNSLKTEEHFEHIIVQERINTGNCGNTVLKTTEQDYIYYKRGIKYYRNIHPNQFYQRNLDGTYETKPYNALTAALHDIFVSFTLAEYYFRKVIEAYPRSPWVEDARDKITLLKKLYERYETIVLEENNLTNYAQYIHEMGLKII